MILTEIWEIKEEHGEYMKFRKSEGQEGWLARIMSSLVV